MDTLKHSVLRISALLGPLGLYIGTGLEQLLELSGKQKKLFMASLTNTSSRKSFVLHLQNAYNSDKEMSPNVVKYIEIFAIYT
jgi:hypothetical protein